MKFFRKIRQKLFAENKFSKYLLYAIGEIILVVIGILIALAINNYNQERSLRYKEQVYLEGLREEFQTSKLKLKELIQVNRNNYSGAKKLVQLSANNDTTSEEEFSEILYSTFSFDISFNPNNSLLNEMINSGSLKDIQNRELRERLTNWFSRLEESDRQEEDLGSQREKVLEIFNSNHYSLRTILDQTNVNDEIGLPESENQKSNLELLNSTKFENMVLMFILSSYATEETHYVPLMQEIDSILTLIDQEIEVRD